MNPLLKPGTLKTILNSAPVVIQGAGTLIRMIKERNQNRESPDREALNPVTTEELHAEITRLEQRLDLNSESDVEQIRLIEQLARQNEVLAQSLSKAGARINLLATITAIALLLALLAIARVV